jgi:hypothetical protein
MCWSVAKAAFCTRRSSSTNTELKGRSYSKLSMRSGTFTDPWDTALQLAAAPAELAPINLLNSGDIDAAIASARARASARKRSALRRERP